MLDSQRGTRYAIRCIPTLLEVSGQGLDSTEEEKEVFPMSTGIVKLTVNITEQNRARLELLATELGLTKTDAVNQAINMAYELQKMHGKQFYVRDRGYEYEYRWCVPND